MYVSFSLSLFVLIFKHLHIVILLFESGLCFCILFKVVQSHFSRLLPSHPPVG